MNDYGRVLRGEPSQGQRRWQRQRWGGIWGV